MIELPDSLADLLGRHRRNLVLYAVVSAISIGTGQVILFGLYHVAGWTATLANVAAVALSAIPAYVLNRSWVWGRKRPRHDLRREIVPFWGMAFAGLVVSTLVVAWAERTFAWAFAPNVAYIAAFGVLWLAKYLVLDTWVFADAT